MIGREWKSFMLSLACGGAFREGRDLWRISDALDRASGPAGISTHFILNRAVINHPRPVKRPVSRRDENAATVLSEATSSLAAHSQGRPEQLHSRPEPESQNLTHTTDWLTGPKVKGPTEMAARRKRLQGYRALTPASKRPLPPSGCGASHRIAGKMLRNQDIRPRDCAGAREAL